MTLPLRSITLTVFARENTWVTASASAVVFALLAYNTTHHDSKHSKHQHQYSIRHLYCKTIQGMKNPYRQCRLALSSLFSNTQHLLKLVYRWSWHLLIPWSRSRSRSHRRYQGKTYETYPTKEAEQQYWLAAKMNRRILQSFDARFQCVCGNSSMTSRGPVSLRTSGDEYEERVPVISSYQPALPPLRNRNRNREETTRRWQGPQGREGRKAQSAGERYHLPLKAFCKWYRLVYPERRQPSTIEALHLIETYTEEDKREIHRISRLKPLASRRTRTRRRLRVEGLGESNVYRELWDRWIESKDLVVVFEN